MALGDLMASSRFSQSPLIVVSNSHSQSHSHNHFDDCASSSSSSYALDDGDFASRRRDSEASTAAAAASVGYVNGDVGAATSMAYLPQTVVLCELRHEAFEASAPAGPAVNGLVSKWRPKERSKRAFFCVSMSKAR
ncbi:Regulatory-associated protein of TOR [Stylosanthes scabra]|uniref:Regulatory-associated protein of TOR n=1 Tax=Stylosanthes scabra TaxID=79078 RepID=A0ABU6VCG5_9FABA|nr:Regulatory-associated protein of TOR [Stylosanthes scabra]